MMTLASLLAMIGLPDEAIDTVAGEASFRVDDQIDLTVALTADAQFLRLKALIGHAADPGDGLLHERIATANYAGALTGGGALGLNPVNGEILLFQELPVALCEPSGLQSVVSRLIDAAILLQGDLAELAGATDASEAITGSEPAASFQRPVGWLRG